MATSSQSALQPRSEGERRRLPKRTHGLAFPPPPLLPLPPPLPLPTPPPLSLLSSPSRLLSSSFSLCSLAAQAGGTRPNPELPLGERSPARAPCGRAGPGGCRGTGTGTAGPAPPDSPTRCPWGWSCRARPDWSRRRCRWWRGRAGAGPPGSSLAPLCPPPPSWIRAAPPAERQQPRRCSGAPGPAAGRSARPAPAVPPPARAHAPPHRALPGPTGPFSGPSRAPLLNSLPRPLPGSPLPHPRSSRDWALAGPRARGGAPWALGRAAPPPPRVGRAEGRPSHHAVIYLPQ